MALPRPPAVDINAPPALWLRSSFFDHGLLGIPIRQNRAKTALSGNLAACSSALIDLYSGKDWAETVKQRLGWTPLEAETIQSIFSDFYMVEESQNLADVAENAPLARQLRFGLFLFAQVFELNRPRRSSQLSDYDAKMTPAATSEDLDPAQSQRQVEVSNRAAFFKSHLSDMLPALLAAVGSPPLVPTSVLDALGFVIGASDAAGVRVKRLSALFATPPSPSDVCAKVSLWLREDKSLDVARTPLQSPVIVSSHVVLKNARDFCFMPAQQQGLSSGLILDCRGATILLLSPLNYTLVANCHDCTLVLGPALGVLTMDHCERTKVVGLCSRLRIVNCVDVKVNAWTRNRPLIKGDSRGVVLGPLSSRYPSLKSDMERVAPDFSQVVDQPQLWRKPLVLDVAGLEEQTEQGVFAIQSVDDFCFEPALGTEDIYVPPLPQEFAARMEQRKKSVEETTRLVHAASLAAEAVGRPGGSQQARADLHAVIQVAFRDYLADANQVEALLDMLHPHNDVLP